MRHSRKNIRTTKTECGIEDSIKYRIESQRHEGVLQRLEERNSRNRDRRAAGENLQTREDIAMSSAR